jgi:hypothetical protein
MTFGPFSVVTQIGPHQHLSYALVRIRVTRRPGFDDGSPLQYRHKRQIEGRRHFHALCYDEKSRRLS